MKKVISILAILMVIACAVFAETGDKLNVTAKVNAVNPEFKIYGGTSAAKIETEGTQSGATIETNVDVSSTAVKIYLKVTQEIKSKYKGTVTLTVTPTELINTDPEIEANTAVPTVANLASGSAATALATNNYSVAPTKEDATGIVTLPITYNGKPVNGQAAAKTIATWDYTWAAVADLPVGNYTATITLTYEVN